MKFSLLLRDSRHNQMSAVLIVRYNVISHVKTLHSSAQYCVQRVLEFCSALSLSLSRNNNIFQGKTAPLNSYILGFASHHRLKCVRSQIPPRRPASPVQLVWHNPAPCDSPSLNIAVSLPICLGMRLACAPTSLLLYELLRAPAVCGECISGANRRCVAHFYDLF